MLTALVLLVAAAGHANGAASKIPIAGGCKWQFHDPTVLGSSTAATFDVSNLTLPTSSQYSYLAHDPYNEQDDSDKYIYKYNICGAVPGAALSNTQCVAGGGLQYAAAYRLKTDPTDDDEFSISDDGTPQPYEQYCRAMTASINQKYGQQSAYAALHDPMRPAHGWTITYPAGVNMKCNAKDGMPEQNLQFRHTFICVDRPMPTAQQTNQGKNWTLVLTERDETGCYLSIYAFGHAGCPKECPVVNGQLCGGNGICGYDKANHTARCFCNDDFIEADCSTPLDPTPTGAIVGAVFGGLFLGAAIIGAYWYFRVRNGAAGPAQADGYFEAAE